MRLDFNILWVEDQPGYVEAQADQIRFRIKKQGFNANVKYCASVEEAMTFLGEDLYSDNIDLVLMDYDFGEGAEKGDVGIEKVRQKFPYKDIVFYSAQAKDLKQFVAKKQVDGIDCSRRDDLPDTVSGVFEKLVRKVVDIDHSRGIVLGATSDIDHSVIGIIQAILNSDTKTLSPVALKKINEKVKKKKKSFEKDCKTFEDITNPKDALAHSRFFTTADRLSLLHTLLNAVEHESKDMVAEYREKIVPKRNQLGHIHTIKEAGFVRRFVGTDKEIVTVEQMKELRVELVEFSQSFDALVEEFSPVSAK